MSCSPWSPILLFKITSVHWEAMLSISSVPGQERCQTSCSNDAVLCAAFSSAPSAILCWVKGLLHSGIVDVHTPVPNLSKLQTIFIHRYFLSAPILSKHSCVLLSPSWGWLASDCKLEWSERQFVKMHFPGMAAGMHLCILVLAWLWISASRKTAKVSLIKMSFLKTIFPELSFSLFWSHERQVGRKRMRVWKVNEGWWAVSDRCATYTCISQGLILQVDFLLKTSFIFSFHCYLSEEYFSTALMLAHWRLPCAALQASALHLSQYIWIFNFFPCFNWDFFF